MAFSLDFEWKPRRFGYSPANLRVFNVIPPPRLGMTPVMKIDMTFHPINIGFLRPRTVKAISSFRSHLIQEPRCPPFRILPRDESKLSLFAAREGREKNMRSLYRTLARSSILRPIPSQSSGTIGVLRGLSSYVNNRESTYRRCFKMNIAL